MKKWALLTALWIYAFFALSAAGEDIHTVNKTRYELHSIQAFQVLLDHDDHESIKHRIINEEDDELKTQYKAMTLSYIEEQTKVITSKVQNKEMDLASAKHALDALQHLLAEVDGLFRSFDMVETLQQSNDHYRLGRACYDSLDYDGAKMELEQVDVIHEGYHSARGMIKTIDEFNALWDERIASGLYGRNPNGVPYQDGCLVFPHTEDGVTMIMKYDMDADTTEVIPITDIKGKYRIEGINLIGEHIYFVAGEEVGKGYGLEAPYKIYRMKRDGSDMVCLAKGHFFDLVCYKDKFYALSYTEGLVQFDRHMLNKRVIAEGNVLSIHPREEGMYYTILDDYSYASSDSLFLFNGENHIKLMTGRNLRCYFYDDFILYHRYAYGDVEHLYRVDYGMESHRRLLNVNIADFIGQVDDVIIMATDGKSDQNQYLSYDTHSGDVIRHSKTYEIIDYQVLGVCQETQSLLINKQGDIYLSDLAFDQMKEITISTIDDGMLMQNKSVLKANSYYKEQETVTVMDDVWLYASQDTYISIEREFMQSRDATVYIAHIRTKEPNGVHVGYYDKSPGRTRARADEIARVNNAAFAVNGDFWAEGNNPWTGIIIRDGKLYKKSFEQDMIVMHPDSGMECYSAKYDDISGEELLAQGVRDTLSFGPVLLDDFAYGHLVDRNFLWGKNPRTAMGMIDPNHYVFICCDGRSKKSRGLTLRRLAELFLDQGCGEAYNLDGGQSMSIVFMGEMLNTHQDERNPCKHRYMSEIVYVPQSRSAD